MFAVLEPDEEDERPGPGNSGNNQGRGQGNENPKMAKGRGGMSDGWDPEGIAGGSSSTSEEEETEGVIGRAKGRSEARGPPAGRGSSEDSGRGSKGMSGRGSKGMSDSAGGPAGRRRRQDESDEAEGDCLLSFVSLICYILYNCIM